MHQKWFLSLLITLLLSTCRSPAIPVQDQESLLTREPGLVSSSLPENVDPDARYLIYLHGKIIEDQGVDAVSPEYGAYEFEEVLDYLAGAGFNVIAEVRAAQTDVDVYSDHVAGQVDTLMAQGVPGENITILGYSKGAAIAMYTSMKLKNPELNFVLLAICGDWSNDDPSIVLAGRILSLYEKSDEFGSTCKPVVKRSSGVTEFEEIQFDTGKQHGAFYSADPIWLDAVVSWLNEADP